MRKNNYYFKYLSIVNIFIYKGLLTALRSMYHAHLLAITSQYIDLIICCTDDSKKNNKVGFAYTMNGKIVLKSS